MLMRDPLKAFEEIGRQADGEVARLDLGLFRPYLVTRPDHVQRVLRDNAANYRREGMMWKPLSRLVGEPSGADPAWPLKRNTFQTLLTGKNIETFTDEMAVTIAGAVDELGRRVGTGVPVDASAEMTRIVYRAITRIFVGDKLSMSEVDELGRAITIATTSSFRSRMLLPFVPNSFPLPGDRAFQRAVQDVDDIIMPIVRESRRHEADGSDIVSLLLRTRAEDGTGLDDRDVRDGIVSLFVAGTETTVTALTWLWVVLDAHPKLASKLYAEIDRVVGMDQPVRSHLSDLRYTKMVLQELLRMYSIGWITPRTVAADDIIDGVRIKRGATVLISPYLTHRLPEVWPRPQTFDPERFAPGNSRHRFAYLAFGAGPHQCVGSLFFTVEAQLILATLISRFRPVLHRSQVSSPMELQVGLTLKPRQRVEISLQHGRR
jgi:cytochrome P450